jgi:hypothetical protein
MTITIDVLKAVQMLISTAFFLGGIWCFAVAVVGGL